MGCSILLCKSLKNDATLSSWNPLFALLSPGNSRLEIAAFSFFPQGKGFVLQYICRHCLAPSHSFRIFLFNTVISSRRNTDLRPNRHPCRSTITLKSSSCVQTDVLLVFPLLLHQQPSTVRERHRTFRTFAKPFPREEPSEQSKMLSIASGIKFIQYIST